MDLFEHLEKQSQNAGSFKKWSGTFREFLRLFETNEYPLLGVLSHQRVHEMIMQAGVHESDHFGNKRKNYSFFEDKLFGIEESIDNIMSYIHSAAKKSETSRRMLLLYGPPSSGKSEMIALLKRGLEEFSMTKEGGIFAIADSKMHENPFLLVPHKLRPEFAKQYGVDIEGDLGPATRYRLENEFNGRFMDFPVEQIFLSEAMRVGIGTWLPQDPKGQDQSELIGSIDFAKIQDVGSESDPRSYNFDGELNVANRGMMEFVEGLKSSRKDTYIPTSSGLKQIGDIHGRNKDRFVANECNLKVANGKTIGNIIRSCYKGFAKCKEITTRKGYTFCGSIDHQIYVLNQSGDFEWKSLKELNIGDKIAISTKGQWSEHVPYLPRLQFKKFGAKKIKLPRKMSRNLARFLGYYVAEGNFNNYCVSISNTNQDIIADIENIVHGFGLHATYRKHDDKIIGVNISSVMLVDLLRNIGLKGNDSDCKVIPQIILDSPKLYVSEFLQSYFDGDGTVNDHRISCSTSSKNLAKQMQIVLLNFGIISSINPVWNTEYSKYYYNVVMDSVHRDKFMQEIGFSIQYKTIKAQNTIRTRDEHDDTIDCPNLFANMLDEIKELSVSVLSPIAGKHYSREKEDHALISRRLYSNLWSWANGEREASQREIRNSINEIPDVASKGKLATIVNGEYYFDSIKNIGVEHLEEIYDVHETVNHSYVGNGLVHHNSDERFLRVLLTATQEKSIKAPRFGMIYIDAFIVLHTNETEFLNFMSEKKYEAYHDRMVIVKVPYNLSVSNEVKIYEKLLSNSGFSRSIHIAPHTLYTAAMFSVLTRLEPPRDGDLSVVKKMKLYDSQNVKGYKLEQVPDLKKKSPREGMSGVSPRFVIDQISVAIARAEEEGRDFITPLDILRQLNKGVMTRDTFKAEDKNSYERHIDMARSEWNELLRNDIQKSFFIAFEPEAKNLFENYLDQIEAACAGQKLKDPVTGFEVDPDEKLMRSVEDHIEVSSSGRDDFRNEILRYVGQAVRKNKSFDYTQHSQLREAIQKQLFAERIGVIRLTVTSRNPDPDELRRRNDVIDRMVQQQGYTASEANELLKYATAHLFDK